MYKNPGLYNPEEGDSEFFPVLVLFIVPDSELSEQEHNIGIQTVFE